MPSQLPSLLYLHGFNSSPASKKARQLVLACERLDIIDQLRAPALHQHPREAMRQCEQAIAELGAPLLIGSSLGGYYATYLAERHGLKALLINPAVRPHARFDGNLGPQKNLYSGETWQLTLDHIHALAELEVPPPADPQRFQVWLQTGDETLDYRQAETWYRGCALRVQAGGDHSYQGFAQQLPALFAFAGFEPSLWRDHDFSDL